MTHYYTNENRFGHTLSENKGVSKKLFALKHSFTSKCDGSVTND